MPWTIIEVTSDETGDVTTHIVPFTPFKAEFDTQEKAWAFLDEMEAIGNPVVNDENNEIIGLHIGHTLSPKCVCSPKPMESDPYCYIHKAAN
jgi:hypothetical protein